MVQGKFCKLTRDNNGNPIGIANENPILDSREYVVEFKEGTEAELSSNAISQSIYYQCDPDGHV